MANENVDGSLSFKASIAVETDKLVRSFQKIKSIVTSAFKDMQGAATRAYTQMDKDLQRSRTEVGTLQEKLEQQAKLLNELRSGLSGNKYKAFSGLGAIKEAEKEYRNLIEQLTLAEQEMQEYGHRIHVVENESQTSIVNGTKKLESMIQKYRELLIQKNELDQQGYTTGDATYDKIVNQIARLGEAIERYKQKLLSADTTSKESTNHVSAFSRILTRLRFALNGVASAFTRAFSKTRTRLINAAESATAKFANNLKSKLTPSFNKSGRSLKKLTRLLIKYIFGVRSFFFLYRKIRKSVSEGLGSLVLVDDRTNRSISDFKTALNTLRGALASAFSPIINVVAPILTRFINLLTTVTDSIGMFIAYLTGQKTYYKAASVYQDYAESLQDEADAASDAAKANKEYLSGLDEIRKWDSGNDSGGSGSGGGGGNDATQGLTWEEVEIPQSIKNLADSLKEYFENGKWEELGQSVGEKINGIVNKIDEAIKWENVGPKITPAIDAITTTFNSLITAINWKKIGSTIGDGVNTIINTANLLLTGINWENIGKSLSEGVRGLITTVEWDTLGQTVANAFNTVIDSAHGFVTNMNKVNPDTGLTGWEEAGNALADAVTNFFGTIHWDKVGSSFSSAITGIFKTISTFFEEADWVTIADGIKTAFSNINWEGVFESVSEAAGAAFGGLSSVFAELFGDAISDFVDWWNTNAFDEAGNLDLIKLGAALDKKWEELSIWVRNNIIIPFLNGFGQAFYSSDEQRTITAAGGSLGDALLQGIQDKFSNLTEWIRHNIIEPFAMTIKLIGGKITNDEYEDWVEEFTGWTEVEPGEGIWDKMWGFLEPPSDEDFQTKIVTPLQGLFNKFGKFTIGLKDNGTELWNGVKTNWNSAVDRLGLPAALKFAVSDDSESWKSSVNKNWLKVNPDNDESKAIKITMTVKNLAAEWWEKVKTWWENKTKEKEQAGKGLTFTAQVKSTVNDWVEKIKTSWGSSSKISKILGYFKMGVSNTSGTWSKSITTNWKANPKISKILGYFKMGVADTSNTWRKTVTTDWKANPKTVQNLGYFSLGVRNNSKTWADTTTQNWKTKEQARGLLGYFSLGVRNNANTWANDTESHWNVKEQARGLLGWFSLGVRNDAPSWFNTSNNNWINETANKTLSPLSVTIGTPAQTLWDSVETRWKDLIAERKLTLNASATVNTMITKAAGMFAGGGTIFSTGRINAYAGGTARAHGSMFIAGEAGPEIVGHIGGKSEVLNRSQLAYTMYKAVSAGVGLILEKFGSWIASEIALNTNALIASQENILSRVSIPAIARGSALPANSTFMSAMNGGFTDNSGNNLSEQDLRRIVREESGGRGANYEFVAQINRRTLFDEFIQEARLRQMQTGKNPFEFA